MNKFSDQNKAPNGKQKDNNGHHEQDVSTRVQKKTAVVAADKSGTDKTSKAQTLVVTSATKADEKTNALKSKWKSKVNAAKSNWGKLSASELLKSDGDAKNLAELVQLRYSISLTDANKQVKQFLDKCNS